MSNFIAKDRIVRRTLNRKGRGFVNTLINKLPIELHIPGYNYCGPGTKLNVRLQRGDRGVNQLDEACKKHDIAYSLNSELSKRHEADNKLYETAVQQIKSKDSKFGEKVAASAVAAIMKAKTKFGMGVKRRGMKRSGRRKHQRKRGGAMSFTQAMKRARTAISRSGSKNLIDNVKVAMTALKKAGKKIRPPGRVIRVPKRGGFLPLIPLFAALGALGSLGGGAAAIAKAVNDAKEGRDQLKEAERHNRAIEEKAVGGGFYIKPYKSGCGIYSASNSKN